MGGVKQFLISYVATGVVFLAIDAVWLGVVAKTLYRRELGSLLLDNYRLAPAAIFYLLYVLGVVVLAVLPAFTADRWTTALLNGALLGLVAYATYDLTNQATLRDWPSVITLVDLAWGTVLTAVSATAGYLVAAAVLRWTA